MKIFTIHSRPSRLFAMTLAATISVFAASGTVLANLSSPVKSSQSHNFSVFLDKRKIGYHRVTIDRQDELQQVHTVAKFDVRILFVPVYSYKHETRELWQGDCLASVSSSTADNGKKYFIDSQKNPENIRLTTQDGESSIDGCIRTFAYWDIDMLKSQKLLNTQTGEYLPAEISELGIQPFEIDGAEIKARQYQLSFDDRTIDLWYTQDFNWLALESVTDSGAVLRYIPENPDDFGIALERS